MKKANYSQRCNPFIAMHLTVIIMWFIHSGVILYKYWDAIQQGEISSMFVVGHGIYMIPVLLLIEVFRLGYEVVQSKGLLSKISAGIVAALDVLIGIYLVTENWAIVAGLLTVPTLWNAPLDVLFTGLEWSAIVLCSVYLGYCLLLNRLNSV